MLRRPPTRVELGNSDRDEIEERRRQDQPEQRDQPVFEHVTLDRDLGTTARIGLTQQQGRRGNNNNDVA